jgi:hypothetical protein
MTCPPRRSSLQRTADGIAEVCHIGATNNVRTRRENRASSEHSAKPTALKVFDACYVVRIISTGLYHKNISALHGAWASRCLQRKPPS